MQNVEEAQKLLQDLLNAGLFLRARSINNTRFMQPDMARTWADEALYAWIYEGSQLMLILGALVLLLAALAIVMFPLWPSSMRSMTKYVMYLGIGLFASLIVISVVRVIVFVVTKFTVKPGIWIFPNLWEDCGVLESFVPFWDWHTPSTMTESKKTD